MSIIATDIDSDGDMDVVTQPEVSEGFTLELIWYENDGTEQFNEHGIYTNLGFAFGASLSAADMDLIRATSVTNLGGGPTNPISWFENDGSEQFTEHFIDALTFGTSVAAADVDGDGDMDVLSTALGDYDSSSKVFWYENDGSQRFTKHTLDRHHEGAISAIAADLDGDSDLDLLSVLYGDDYTIAWYENEGAGFSKHVISDTAYAGSVYAADLDGDGDLDLLGGLAWFENIDGQEFTQHDIESDFRWSSVISAADMDGDGDLDLVGGSWRDGTLIWFENVSPPPPTDLTGDGFVDFDDLTLLLAHWDQMVSAAQGNLVDPLTTPVNFQDLTFLLAVWTGPSARWPSSGSASSSGCGKPVPCMMKTATNNNSNAETAS